MSFSMSSSVASDVDTIQAKAAADAENASRDSGAGAPHRLRLSAIGERVGVDEFGNVYYRERGGKRRWVIYNGYADASRVPSDWHGWMHHTFEHPPTEAPLKRQDWEKDHHPNLTGTVHAYRPSGSLARAEDRQAASGDYEAWKPE